MLFLWILGYFHTCGNISSINKGVRVVNTLIENRYLY